MERVTHFFDSGKVDSLSLDLSLWGHGMLALYSITNSISELVSLPISAVYLCLVLSLPSRKLEGPKQLSRTTSTI